MFRSTENDAIDKHKVISHVLAKTLRSVILLNILDELIQTRYNSCDEHKQKDHIYY